MICGRGRSDNRFSAYVPVSWSSEFVVNACRLTSPGIWGQNAIGSECFRERIGRENDPLVDEFTEMSGFANAGADRYCTPDRPPRDHAARSRVTIGR